MTDPKDPDYEIGFRAYGFWGFQRSMAAQLDQKTMYSLRPGTEIINYLLPASARYGELRDPKGTAYPNIFKGEDLGTFNFFEASSIRKVGNKYVSVYSGYSGPEYGVGSSNSTLRYAVADSPLGPWKSGGVLVDSRAPVLNKDGSAIETSNAGHNTHGSIELINGQWYVFYHRPPRGFGFARQAVVEPIRVSWDEKSVKDGGMVAIRAFDPFQENLTIKDKQGKEYKGAEVTSEGFHFYGLDPYRYYSAGYACYLSYISLQQDSWDVWDNHMPVTNMKNGTIAGFKYFGFGGLKQDKFGLKAFEGTKKGNRTTFNLFITPKTQASFKVNVWLDSPWDNETWKGKRIAQITVPANTATTVKQFTVDVSNYVDHLDGKHALFLVAEGEEGKPLFDFIGLGFSSKDKKIERPVPPSVTITVNGKKLMLPSIPVRSTDENGIVGYNHYEVTFPMETNDKKIPVVKAMANNPEVEIKIKQGSSFTDYAQIDCVYKGQTKSYLVKYVKN
ncbi:Xylosidase/arabinosidase [compost metagenome]